MLKIPGIIFESTVPFNFKVIYAFAETHPSFRRACYDMILTGSFLFKTNFGLLNFILLTQSYRLRKI